MGEQPPTEADETHRADYSWTLQSGSAKSAAPDAERLLRATWEEGPAVLSWSLPLAWKFGLGLRLGPKKSAEHVLGWPITQRTSGQIAVATSSRIMQAQNSLLVDGDVITWTTLVTYNNLLGRLLWVPARIVHQWLVRRSLSGALSRLAD